jgi:hypothetical protein
VEADGRILAGAFELRGAIEVQDMQALLEESRAMMESGGSGRDVSYERESHWKGYADDSHVYFPGNWFMAGHPHGRLEVDGLWRAVRPIRPQGTRLFRNHFFVGEDSIAIEWRSRNEVSNGVSAQNGWRERIVSPLGSDLPSWPEPGTPRDPRPETHE